MQHEQNVVYCLDRNEQSTEEPERDEKWLDGNFKRCTAAMPQRGVRATTAKRLSGRPQHNEREHFKPAHDERPLSLHNNTALGALNIPAHPPTHQVVKLLLLEVGGWTTTTSYMYIIHHHHHTSSYYRLQLCVGSSPLLSSSSSSSLLLPAALLLLLSSPPSLTFRSHRYFCVSCVGGVWAGAVGCRSKASVAGVRAEG